VAAALSQAKLHSAALGLYQACARLWPENKSGLLLERGLAYARKGDFEKALDSAREAMALEPDDAWGHIYMSWIFERQGKLQAAVDHYRRALAMGSDLTDSMRAQLESRIRTIAEGN
jgi:protein O-GlcNAc transferase